MIQGDFRNIVENIRHGNFARIATLAGAGISVASGIPDFRSPGGMYETLRPELLTASEQHRELLRRDPTLVVDYRLFSVNQLPYLEVRRPFILGTAERKWKPTAAHYFIRLLNDKNLLQRHYTQNIDGLDSHLSLPQKKVVNIHGSLHEIKCEFCGSNYPSPDFMDAVKSKIRNIYDSTDSEAPSSSSYIHCLKCQRSGVKPATVLYGKDLPQHFFRSIREDFPNKVDLLLVFGTSLTVMPACNLVNRVAETVPRLIVNREKVGENLGLDYGTECQGSSARDGIFIGDCDKGVIYLADKLGWLEDLRAFADDMCPSSALAVRSYSSVVDK